MLEFLTLQKIEVLKKYPFFSQFLEDEINVDRFLEDLERFKQDLKKEGLSDSDISMLKSFGEATKPIKVNRRTFIRTAGAAGILALIGLKSPAAVQAGEVRGLFDLQFGVYRKYSEALKREQAVKRKLHPSLRRHLMSRKQGRHYKIFIDVNTTKKIAEQIKNEWFQRGGDNDIIIVPEIQIYWPKNNKFNQYTVLPVEKDIAHTAIKYLTVYSSKDILPTVRTLKSWNQKTGYGKGQYVIVLKAWLKPFIREGLVEGTDYFNIAVQQAKRSRSSVEAIASNYAVGVLGKIQPIMLKFNKIENSQLRELWDGVPIAIPKSIYHDITVPRTEDDKVAEQPPAPGKPVPKGAKISSDLRELGFPVLRDTKIPSAMIEAFFVTNDDDLRFFSKDANLNQFADASALGVHNYAKKYGIRNIVLSVGHGKTASGVVGHIGSKTYRESDFNRKIVTRMKSRLAPKGYNVVVLDYALPGKGKALQRARLKAYVTAVNKYSKADSIFVSIHCNGWNDKSVSGTRVFATKPLKKNPKSSQLGTEILKSLGKVY
ncbi:N-acetylmuramoyl-L-alanine amidase [Thermoproteota archaeon]